jgi:hypothetical protein
MSSPDYHLRSCTLVVFLIMYVSSVQPPLLLEIPTEIMDEEPRIEAWQRRQGGVRRHHEVLGEKEGVPSEATSTVGSGLSAPQSILGR